MLLFHILTCFITTYKMLLGELKTLGGGGGGRQQYRSHFIIDIIKAYILKMTSIFLKNNFPPTIIVISNLGVSLCNTIARPKWVWQHHCGNKVNLDIQWETQSSLEYELRNPGGSNISLARLKKGLIREKFNLDGLQSLDSHSSFWVRFKFNYFLTQTVYLR